MNELINLLSEPWRLEFMQRGLIAAVLISIVAAVVGSFVVLKGMAFVGDALPHASFGGVAIAFVLGANLQLGAAAAALLSALAIGLIARRGLVRYDTAIGMIFMASFALGILLVSRQDSYTADLFSFVFGSVLAVSWNDVWIIVVVSLAIVAVIVLFYKELLFTAYDPTMAAASGLPATAIQYGLLALIGLTVAVALQVMGIVLVLAMLVAPPATAQLLTRSLPGMMLIGAAIGVLASFTGLMVAWYADVSASASIVLIATGFFIAALVFSPRQGVLAKLRQPLLTEDVEAEEAVDVHGAPPETERTTHG